MSDQTQVAKCPRCKHEFTAEDGETFESRDARARQTAADFAEYLNRSLNPGDQSFFTPPNDAA